MCNVHVDHRFASAVFRLFFPNEYEYNKNSLTPDMGQDGPPIFKIVINSYHNKDHVQYDSKL